MTQTGRPEHRLYGRGAGRPLSPYRAGLVAEALNRFAVPEGPFDPRTLEPGCVSACLEIGFGGGEHLIGQAQRRPQTLFLGVEPFLEGVGKACAQALESGVTNVRLVRGDARPVLARLAPGSLQAVYVLFPDPWPKRRHWKRRMIQPETLDAMATALEPAGRLRVATDVRSYVDWTLQHVRRHRNFLWTARQPADWRTPPADHVTTRYEAKNIGDCPPTFLDFSRRSAR